MGISELRHLKAREPVEPAGIVERDLIRRGTISRSDAQLAQLVQRHCDASLGRILLAEGLAEEADLLQARARQCKSRSLTAEDLENLQPAPTAMAPAALLKNAVLPVTDRDGSVALVSGDPVGLAAVAKELPAEWRGARILPAPRNAVQNAVAGLFRDKLTEAAQSRVPNAESSRSWGNNRRRRIIAVISALAGLAGLALAFPTAVFAVFTLWAAFTLIVSAVLKTSAFIAGNLPVRRGLPADIAGPKPPLPKVSILVPLFRETEIAHALIARLTRLTYPKCLLDVVLILEEEDALTRETLAGIDLPPWIRPVVVPDGGPRTKPRAMNYALDFCEGDIIGIFDAEDAPDPDQITTIARRFQQAPEDVVCLQGILDYYNPRQSWLARCFTIEYATWFRRMLPGMARLGFTIPLGGTTLYFRRDILERLGGWDAHNVTEDADLGFRLARHGYRTEMIETVTGEEANCHPWAWIKQRSRWLKGYMTTYLVHMRRPRLLYRQLGAWKFWGFQAHFISALSQFVLAPFLWSFWLVLLGLPHPLDPVLPRSVLLAFGSLFLMVEVLNIACHAMAVSGPRHRHLFFWAPTMHFYAPLGAAAAYKALYELVFKPFFWDKTVHGHSLAGAGKKVSDRAVDFTGIQLEPGHERL